MKMNKKKVGSEYSTGYAQARGFLVDWTNTKTAQRQIISLRKRYNIPDRGYEPEYPSEASVNYDWQKKQLVFPPTEWRKKFPADGKRFARRYSDLEIEIEELWSDVGVHCDVWPNPLEAYIFYNFLEEPRFGEGDASDLNLCFISDTQQDGVLERRIMQGTNEYEKKLIKLKKKKEKRYFPIAIYISPYASLTAIREYLSKAYPTIASMQKKYKDPNSVLGSAKSRDPMIERRDAYIIECGRKGVSHKKIASNIRTMFPHLADSPDHGTIAKIISKNKQKESNSSRILRQDQERKSGASRLSRIAAYLKEHDDSKRV